MEPKPQIQKFPFKKIGQDAESSQNKSAQFKGLAHKVLISPEEIKRITDAAAVAQEEQKAPSFSEQDVRESRNKGYEEGYAKGFSTAKAAEAEIQKKIEASLGDVSLKLAAISEAVKTRNNNHVKELAELVIRISRKVADTALKQEPYSEIEKVLAGSLPLLFDEPKIIIYVSADLVQNIKEKITSLAKREGFKHEIEIHGNPNLSPGSCDIEWQGGGLRSRKEDLWQQVEELCKVLRSKK